MKCISCHREATFDSPKKYCDYHWAYWWAEGTVGPEEVKKETRRILREIERKYGRQK